MTSGTIRVFYLINSFAQGGAERQMAELVRRLPRDRFEPILCLLQDENAYGYLLPPDQPRYVMRNGVGLASLGTLREWLRTERPHIVHSFMEYSNLWSRLLAPGIGDPIVVTSVRGPLMDVKYGVIEGLLSSRCDVIGVNSVGIRDELVNWEHVPPRKIRIIRNILDTERFRPAGDGVRERIRAELGLRGPTFLVPGRIAFEKYQFGVGLAAGLLRLRGRLPDGVTFLLAGRVEWPADLAVDWAEKLGGVASHFRYLGQYKDVTQLYAAADWVLLPSLCEGLCNAALEAHACARPLLMSHAANLDGILADRVTGYEFGTGWIGPMAEAIERAVATPPELAEAMGRAGRERVLRMFDPDEALRSVIDLYEELMARRKAGKDP